MLLQLLNRILQPKPRFRHKHMPNPLFPTKTLLPPWPSLPNLHNHPINPIHILLPKPTRPHIHKPNRRLLPITPHPKHNQFLKSHRLTILIQRPLTQRPTKRLHSPNNGSKTHHTIPNQSLV